MKYNNHNIKKPIFEQWKNEKTILAISNTISMDYLHSMYSIYCREKNTLPYKRKYFAFLLKKSLGYELSEGKVEIYYLNETLIKGIKIYE